MLTKIRNQIANTMDFSKAEANGAMVLVLLILVIVIVPKVYISRTFSKKESFPEDTKKLMEWAGNVETKFSQSARSFDKTPPLGPKPKSELFTFNPNTATEGQLETLGFNKRVVQNIIKYRLAGGLFKTKSELSKIYGLSKDSFDRVVKYIDLPDHTPTNEKLKKPSPEASVRRPFDLNKGNVENFQAIYGIGPVLSKRIVKFREKLGGFFSKNQLYEVYGLDSVAADSVFSGTTFTPVIQKININTDSSDLLTNHPYIDYRVGKAIINYRKHHGNYQQPEEILQIKIISDSLYQKIYPYLSVY